jgi:hypothetical protein
MPLVLMTLLSGESVYYGEEAAGEYALGLIYRVF